MSASRNADMRARSLRAVWHPCTQMKHHELMPLVPVRRAEGVWLYDFDGNRILDAISSWWVNLLGHGHPRIKAALREAKFPKFKASSPQVKIDYPFVLRR